MLPEENYLLFVGLSLIFFLIQIFYLKAVDWRLFVAWNFSLIISYFLVEKIYLHSALVFAVCVFIVLFLFFLKYPVKSYGLARLVKKVDNGLLSEDPAILVLLISCVSILFNVSYFIEGGASDSVKALRLEDLAVNDFYRWFSYLSYSLGFLCVHLLLVIKTRGMTFVRFCALAVFALASLFSLSKASVLSLVLASFFVYFSAKRILYFVVISVCVAVAVSNMAFGVGLGAYMFLIFDRLLNNVDVLYYMNQLAGSGVDVFDYPCGGVGWFILPRYFYCDDFLVYGVWLHGSLFSDWRGFGPNPTFIGDLIVSSWYTGIVLAPILAMLLRVGDRSPYRVWWSLCVYTLLQDWLFFWLAIISYIFLVYLLSLVRKRLFAGIGFGAFRA